MTAAPFWVIAISLTVPLGVAVTAQRGAEAASIDLFPIDLNCACINTRKKTGTATAHEVTIRGTIFQVFETTDTGRELFRVKLGTPRAKWWNYGIVVEGDFNGDGEPDYSWYGGDDTSDEMLVFISAPNGTYRQLDVRKTVERAWYRRFPKRPPLLFESNPDDELKNIRLRRGSDGLVLTTDVALFLDGLFSLTIPEREFAISDR